MIAGIGTDLIEIQRVADAVQKFEDRFLKRVFTEKERAYCNKRSASLAARFAAKEALLKSLGTGLRLGMRWQDMEVRNDALGKPHLHCSGKVAEEMAQKGIAQVHLSLSHSRDFALATVVLEGVERINGCSLK